VSDARRSLRLPLPPAPYTETDEAEGEEGQRAGFWCCRQRLGWLSQRVLPVRLGVQY